MSGSFSVEIVFQSFYLYLDCYCGGSDNRLTFEASISAMIAGLVSITMEDDCNHIRLKSSSACSLTLTSLQNSICVFSILSKEDARLTWIRICSYGPISIMQFPLSINQNLFGECLFGYAFLLGVSSWLFEFTFAIDPLDLFPKLISLFSFQFYYPF